MTKKTGKVVSINEARQMDRSDKKSFQLVFWLLVAKIAFILLLVGLAVWLLYTVRSAGSADRAAVRFQNPQGAGYTADGSKLWIGSKSGISSYRKGSWVKEKAEKNPPAGAELLPTADGYIQVEPERTVVEQKTIRGDTLETLAIPKGQTGGFWAAGYHSHHLYHLQESNGKLLLHFSTNRGKTWNQRVIKGIKGKVNTFAVHPSRSDVFALATNNGLFFTQDGGSHFRTFLKGEQVSSVSIGFGDPIALLAGTAGRDTALYNIIPGQNKEVNLEIGTVEGDRIEWIVQNPARQGESAILTKNRDVFLTDNGGQNWIILAKSGRGLSGK
ncbi:group-specific protein [Sporolactobacillus sp. THM7-4]|nr:group-specific protein [Sporolactobacillus sp. THM7-4]